MRQKQIESLRANSNRFFPSLELLEQQMLLLNSDSDSDTELWRLARLLYVGQLVEKAGLLYSLNEQAFCHFLAVNKNALLNSTI